MTRVIVSLLYAAALTLVTFAADRAGGHPAKSAPVVLFVVWFVIVVAVRWAWSRVRSRRNDEKDGRPTDR